MDQTCSEGARVVFPLRKCRRSDGAFAGGLFVPPPRQRSLQARHRPCGPEPASVGENLGGWRVLSNRFTVSDVTGLGPFALAGAHEGEPRPCFCARHSEGSEGEGNGLRTFSGAIWEPLEHGDALSRARRHQPGQQAQTGRARARQGNLYLERRLCGTRLVASSLWSYF